MAPPIKQEETTTSESAVAAAAAAAVAAVENVDAAIIQEAAATTAAMGIMMMDPTGGTSGGGDDEAVVAPGMESTGRWTKLEHSKFLQGIEKYGKEWKKVAAFVKTRTVMQTRTHAQKYYEKLSVVALRATGSPLPSKSTSATKPIKIDLSVHPTIGTATTSKKVNTTTPAVPTPFGIGGGATINSAALVVPPIPVLSFTDYDILVPINDATASRPSNKVYMDIMKMNCFIFHSLPITEQLWFARNIVHYLSSVRHHRWIGCNYYGASPQYQVLPEPVSVVQSDFRMDPLKVAAFAFHPFWLLGDHDSSNIHNGHPFIHRTVDGSWKHVTMAQVKDILKGEGPKNLLLLPASISSMEPPTIPPSATTTTATTEETKKEEDVEEEVKDEKSAQTEVKDEKSAEKEEVEVATKDVKEEEVAVTTEEAKEESTSKKVTTTKPKGAATTTTSTTTTSSKRTAAVATTTTKPTATVVVAAAAAAPASTVERRSKRSKV